jgi:hypothetical protein
MTYDSVDIRKILGKTPKNNLVDSTCKVYVTSFYKQKDKIKSFGGKWDPDVKSFYFQCELEADLPTYCFQPKYVLGSHLTIDKREEILKRHNNKYLNILREKIKK